MAKPLRWGILGSGKISHDFVLAAQKILPPNEHEFVAVGARSLESAQKLAQKLHIPHSFGSYRELVEFSEIDIVYVGTVHPSHLQNVKEALLAGKHVLCEKPMGVNSKEVKEMVALARQKGLFLMEAFWSRFFPIYDQLRQDLKDQIIGEVQFVQVTFGRAQDKDFVGRLFDPATAGGALLDMGCYTIQLASLVYQGQRPTKIVATGELIGDNMDGTSCIVLHYPGKKLAQLYVSMTTATDCSAYIYGTKGWIKIPMFFHCPVKMEYSDGRVFEVPRLHCDEEFLFGQDMVGLSYEAKAVRDCILAGQKECSLMSLTESEVIAEIEDEVRRQIGIKYAQDT